MALVKKQFHWLFCLTWLTVATPPDCQAALAPAAQALHPADLAAGVDALATNTDERPFFSDQFRFEYGDPNLDGRDRDCRHPRERGREVDDRCYGRIPVVPEPSTYALTLLGLGFVVVLRFFPRKRKVVS